MGPPPCAARPRATSTPAPHDEPARRRAPQYNWGASVATKRMSDVSELTESDVSEQSEWDALLAQPAEETAVRVAIRSRPQIDGESGTTLRGNHVSVGDTDFGPFDAYARRPQHAKGDLRRRRAQCGGAGSARFSRLRHGLRRHGQWEDALDGW